MASFTAEEEQAKNRITSVFPSDPDDDLILDLPDDEEDDEFDEEEALDVFNTPIQPRYSNAPPLVSTPDMGKLSIKERFDLARRSQAQAAAEKLERVRHNPRESIARLVGRDRRLSRMSRGRSMTDQEAEAIAFLTASTEGKSADDFWSAAMANLRKKQDQRNNLVRITTTAAVNYQAVSTRISQWEEVFLQTEPTALEKRKLFKRAQLAVLAAGNSTADDKWVEASLRGVLTEHDAINNKELIVLGTCRLFPASKWGEEVQSFLDKALDGREKYICLCAGVMPISTRSTEGAANPVNHKPPIRIVALASRATNREIYLAIDISAHPGYEFCAAAFGEFDISVFRPDSTSRLFSQTFIVTYSVEAYKEAEGAMPELSPIEEVEAAAEEAAAAVAALEIHEDQFASDSAEEIDETTEGDTLSHEAVATNDRRVSIRNLSSGGPVMCLDVPIMDRINEVNNNSDDESVAGSDAGGMQDEEEEDRAMLETLEVDQVILREAPQSDQIRTEVTTSAEGLSESKTTASILLNIQQVRNICCTDRMFIAMSSTSSSVISKDFSVTSATTRCAIDGAQIFEWTRGVVISGFAMKGVTKRIFLRPFKRKFFILNDNVLSYHKKRTSFADASKKDGVKGMFIAHDTNLEFTTLAMQRVLKISTPSTGQKMIIQLRDNSDKEMLWLKGLRRTIAIQKMKHTSLGSAHRTVWLNDNPAYSIIAADACKIGNRSYKVALFSFQRSRLDGTSSTASKLKSKKQFFLEINVNNEENLVLDILRIKDGYSKDVEFNTVKIYGDRLILGGSCGFLGVGMVGYSSSRQSKVLFCMPCLYFPRTQVAPMRIPQPIGRADQPAAVTVPTRKPLFGFPHTLSAQLEFVAVRASDQVIVAGDNNRTLSFWYLESAHGPDSLLSVEKGQTSFFQAPGAEFQSRFHLSEADPNGEFADETIRSMSFLADSGQLLVTTSRRMLLLLISSPDDLIGEVLSVGVDEDFEDDMLVRVLGYTLLDEVDENTTALFGLSVVDINTADSSDSVRRITQWRVVSRGLPESPAAPSLQHDSRRLSRRTSAARPEPCVVTRIEWTADLFDDLIDNIRPLTS